MRYMNSCDEAIFTVVVIGIVLACSLPFFSAGVPGVLILILLAFVFYLYCCISAGKQKRAIEEEERQPLTCR